MKVINYNYGYIPEFSCTIHGKIIVSKEEWVKMVKYLLHPRLVLYYSTSKTMLKGDLARRIPTKNGYLVNVRCYATEALAKKFGFKVKRANYMFLVTA